MLSKEEADLMFKSLNKGKVKRFEDSAYFRSYFSSEMDETVLELNILYYIQMDQNEKIKEFVNVFTKNTIQTSLRIKLWIALANTVLNNVEEAEEIFSILQKSDFKDFGKNLYLLTKASIHMKKQEYRNAKIILVSLLEKFDHIEFPYFRAKTLNKLGIMYYSLGNIEKALQSYEEAKWGFNEIGNENDEIKTINNIGYMFWEQNKLEKASDYFEKAKRKSENINNELFVGMITLNLGLLNLKLGYLEQALNHYSTSIQLFKKHDRMDELATAYMNSGIIHDIKGDLEEALKFYNQSLEINTDLSNKLGLARNYHNIGLTITKMGDYKKADKFYNKALELFKEIEFTVDLAKTTYYLFKLSFDKGDMDQATVHLNSLEDIMKGTDSDFVELTYKLGKAIYLSKSDKFIEISKSSALFQEIIDDNLTTDVEYITTAYIGLSDLLLDQYRKSKDSQILEDIDELLTGLEEHGKKLKSIPVQLEASVLKSKLAVAKREYDKARQLLNDAQSIADKHHLENFAVFISKQHDKMLNEIERIEEIIDENVEVLDEMDMDSFESLIGGMVRSKVDLGELEQAEPSIFMIIADTGTTMYSYYFEGGHEVKNEQLIGGFISTISNLVAEAFSTEGIIQRIKHKDYILLFKQIGKILVVYAIKGSRSYHSQQKLDSLTVKLESDMKLWNKFKSDFKRGVVENHIRKKFDRLVEETFLE